MIKLSCENIAPIYFPWALHKKLICTLLKTLTSVGGIVMVKNFREISLFDHLLRDNDIRKLAFEIEYSSFLDFLAGRMKILNI